MKGEISTNMILVLVLATVAAALVIGVVATHSSNAEDGFNETAETTSGQVDNASCKRDCRENHPSQGPGYYTCLQTNGCN